MPRVALPIRLDIQTRSTLKKLVQSSSTPQAMALRSRIVLAAAEGANNQQIAAMLKIPPVTAGKCSSAVCGRETRYSGVGPDTAFVAAERQKGPCLDQRIRPARHPDAVGRPGDCHRQSDRPCPRPPDQCGLPGLPGRGREVLS